MWKRTIWYLTSYSFLSPCILNVFISFVAGFVILNEISSLVLCVQLEFRCLIDQLTILDEQVIAKWLPRLQTVCRLRSTLRLLITYHGYSHNRQIRNDSSIWTTLMEPATGSNWHECSMYTPIMYMCTHWNWNCDTGSNWHECSMYTPIMYMCTHWNWNCDKTLHHYAQLPWLAVSVCANTLFQVIPRPDHISFARVHLMKMLQLAHATTQIATLLCHVHF